ncbi:MAG: hypothetical protein WC254_04875, partial [Candidatus Woesearchaeota archaeon]
DELAQYHSEEGLAVSTSINRKNQFKWNALGWVPQIELHQTYTYNKGFTRLTLDIEGSKPTEFQANILTLYNGPTRHTTNFKKPMRVKITDIHEQSFSVYQKAVERYVHFNTR